MTCAGSSHSICIAQEWLDRLTSKLACADKSYLLGRPPSVKASYCCKYAKNASVAVGFDWFNETTYAIMSYACERKLLYYSSDVYIQRIHQISLPTYTSDYRVDVNNPRFLWTSASLCEIGINADRHPKLSVARHEVRTSTATSDWQFALNSEKMWKSHTGCQEIDCTPSIC